MAIAYNKRPFIWRGRNAARAPRRIIVWVEELESRQVLATVGTMSGNPLLLIQLPRVGPTNPAFVAPVSPGPTTVTTGPHTQPIAPAGAPTGTSSTGTTALFILGNGQTTTIQSLASPATSSATPATLPQTAGAGIPISTVPPPPLPTTLPPILQGATVVPPSGPLTFADLQKITANFIGGGHSEMSNAPNSRPFNPPSTPRPLPSASPNPVNFIPDSELSLSSELPHGPLQAAEQLVPMIAGFEEGPQLVGDQTEEIGRKSDNNVGLRVEASAVPVLAAALVAHWADRHRRPDEEEKDAEILKAWTSMAE